MRRLTLLLVSLVLLSIQSVLAQSFSVKGTVVSAEDNEPMIGVTIMQEGTSNGVVTDIDGNYTIEIKGASKATLQGFDFKSGETKNIFKDKHNPKNYYIVNNDGIVEEYKLNFDDSSKKKKLIEEAIKDKEVLSKIYDELLDTTAYDEVGMNDEFQLSRDSFMNLSSIEDMKSKIEEILGATYTDGLQLEGKYIDNIIDYENCSINLV